MIREGVKPALTAEEWHSGPMGDGSSVGGVAVRGQVRMERDYAHDRWGVVVTNGADFAGVYTPDGQHALAALALYGQPFGFTWEDWDLLREIVQEAYFGGYDGVGWSPRWDMSSTDYGALVDRLADRIAALLPPRPESSSDGGTQDDDTVVPTRDPGVHE